MEKATQEMMSEWARRHGVCARTLRKSGEVVLRNASDTFRTKWEYEAYIAQDNSLGEIRPDIDSLLNSDELCDLRSIPNMPQNGSV